MGKSIKTDKVFFNQIVDKAVSPRDMEGKIEEIEELKIGRASCRERVS